VEISVNAGKKNLSPAGGAGITAGMPGGVVPSENAEIISLYPLLSILVTGRDESGMPARKNTG